MFLNLWVKDVARKDILSLKQKQQRDVLSVVCVVSGYLLIMNDILLGLVSKFVCLFICMYIYYVYFYLSLTRCGENKFKSTSLYKVNICICLS